MGKVSNVLLSSVLIGSAYGDNFSVLSCNDDSTVSISFRPLNFRDESKGAFVFVLSRYIQYLEERTGIQERELNVRRKNLFSRKI